MQTVFSKLLFRNAYGRDFLKYSLSGHNTRLGTSLQCITLIQCLKSFETVVESMPKLKAKNTKDKFILSFIKVNIYCWKHVKQDLSLREGATIWKIVMRIEYVDKSVRVLTLLSLLCKLISFSVVLFISSFKNIFSVLRAWHSCSSDWTCLPQVSVLHGGVAGSSSWRTGWTSFPGFSWVDSFKGSVVGVWSAGGSLLLSWGQPVDALVKTQK